MEFEIEDVKELEPFINEDMKLKAIPRKNKKKLMAIYYLATKLEKGRKYSEKEINELINHWTEFKDPATLRREMFDAYLIHRTTDCSLYWAVDEMPKFEDFITRK